MHRRAPPGRETARENTSRWPDTTTPTSAEPVNTAPTVRRCRPGERDQHRDEHQHADGDAVFVPEDRDAVEVLLTRLQAANCAHPCLTASRPSDSAMTRTQAQPSLVGDERRRSDQVMTIDLRKSCVVTSLAPDPDETDRRRACFAPGTATIRAPGRIRGGVSRPGTTSRREYADADDQDRFSG